MKVQKEGERAKKMFAPHVSPIMIEHSFEDDTANMYSGKWVMRETKNNKERQMGARKVGRDSVECGQETRINLCPTKSLLLQSEKQMQTCS